MSVNAGLGNVIEGGGMPDVASAINSPRTGPTVDVYTTEPNRQAAIAEVTRLRRQFDTTTAAGARAFAKSPEAQAAIANLNAAKAAAGMRTSGQDLAFLNKLEAQGLGGNKMTKALNKNPQKYFNQIQQAYNNPNVRPTWSPGGKVDTAYIEKAKELGVNAENGYYEWVWVDAENTVDGQGKWMRTVIGTTLFPPSQKWGEYEKVPENVRENASNYAFEVWASGNSTIGEAADFVQQVSGEEWGWNWTDIPYAELAQAIPDLTWVQLQEITVRLNKTNITLPEIVDMRNKLFGRR